MRVVRKKLERDVDELHDVMRKNRGRRKKIGKKIRPLYSLDLDIPLPRYTSTFIALIAKGPRSPHPYF